MHSTNKRATRLLAFAIGATLVMGACSGSEPTDVDASGDPVAHEAEVTTTTPPPTTTAPMPTTASDPPPPTTEASLPPEVSAAGDDATTTTTTSAEQPCPPREGEPVIYTVGFHEYPDGLKVGDEFACGVVTHAEPRAPSNVYLDVWDPDDFEERLADDPNIRYVEGLDGYEGGGCQAEGCRTPTPDS
jgi:hypothetical protein